MEFDRGFVIQTRRLGLRRTTSEDRTAIRRMLQNKEVMRAWEHVFSDEKVDAWMAERMAEYQRYGRFGFWAVVQRETGAVIGQCGITLKDGGALGQVPEVAYMLAREFWHQGYGIEAVMAVRDYGFFVIQFPAVYSMIRDMNIPSIRLAERNGMHPLCRVVKRYRGQDMPHRVYGLSRQEWIRIKKEMGDNQ